MHYDINKPDIQEKCECIKKGDKCLFMGHTVYHAK